MKLIGITGKARSGKDAIAKFAWSQYGFTRIAFADAVKLSAQAKFGLTAAQTWDDELKEVVIPHWNMTPRQMFQMEGTEAGRNVFGGDLWIKRFMLSYNLLKHTDDIIVPDVRFDNEAEALRSLGGIIIEVRRGQAGLSGSAGTHVSESGLSLPADYVIDNNGTLEELHEKFEAIVFGDVAGAAQ